MRKSEEITVRQYRTTDVDCDVCGQSTRQEDTGEFQYATLSAYWGWGSGYDGERHTLDLCEECYDKLPDWVRSKVRVRGLDGDRVGI